MFCVNEHNQYLTRPLCFFSLFSSLSTLVRAQALVLFSLLSSRNRCLQCLSTPSRPPSFDARICGTPVRNALCQARSLILVLVLVLSPFPLSRTTLTFLQPLP
jgi:hypothetical protein